MPWLFRLVAPLHDYGKICTPGCVLLKRGGLGAGEGELTNTQGQKDIDVPAKLSGAPGLESQPEARMMRLARARQQDDLDGSGCRQGRRAGRIPLEARITSPSLTASLP